MCLILLGPLPKTAAAADVEKEIRAAFLAFADAIKAKDTDKIWKLLDKESQTAAERSAKSVKSSYLNASAKDKEKLEKALGLTGEELAKLTGELFLKSKGFHGKYHEIPGSMIEKIIVQDKRATIHYVEEDGDKEKLRVAFQEGKWRISAPMPPVPQL